MEIKTFNDKVSDLKQSINQALNTIKEEGVSLPEEEKQLRNILTNPEKIVEQEVSDIASTVEMIKAGEFDIYSNQIPEWLKCHLNISPKSFLSILNKANTPEEAAERILIKMKTPSEIVSQIVNKDEKTPKKLIKK